MVTKLIAGLVTKVQSPQEQILLYKQVRYSKNRPLKANKQLLEDSNPFEPVRVSALTMLREAVTLSNILIPDLKAHLSPILFTLPSSSSRIPSPFLAHLGPTPTGPPLQLPFDQIIVSMWPVWFTECSNLLRMLLIRDTENQTGCKDKEWLKEVEDGWVVPQLKRMEALHGDQADSSVIFTLDRWGDALHRLVETIHTNQ